jgi:hypothetical protein
VNDQVVLSAETNIHVPVNFARSWFLELADHPERYSFESHAGFTFTQGEFGEPGAHFQTEERFAKIAKLKFELTEVAEHRFTFKLRKPIRHIWGYFSLDPGGRTNTRLRLAIGSDRQLQRKMLQIPPIRSAVQHQIEGEVANIANSMSTLYHSEQEA